MPVRPAVASLLAAVLALAAVPAAAAPRGAGHANLETLAELHPDDAAALQVKSGDRVKLTSRRGSETFKVRVVNGARKGLVFAHMHDPDHMCNRLTIDAVDPISRQPEFKICAVKAVKA